MAQAFGLLSGFGPTGSAAGQISVPVAAAVAPSGLLYVTELQNYRVSVFTPQGGFVRAFGRSVSPAGGDTCTAATGCRAGALNEEGGSLYAPTGIGIGPGEEIFVANGGGYRIDVFSPEGVFLRAFGKGVGPGGTNICTVVSQCKKGSATSAAGTLWGPIGVEVDSSGTVYATTASARIEMFTAAGSFLGAFGKGVNPSGGNTCTAVTGCKEGTNGSAAGAMSGPFDIAIGPGGQIAVTNANNNRVDVFDSAGQFLYAFGQGVSPTGDSNTIGSCTTATGCNKGVASGKAGSLSMPTGMAINQAGNLLVAEFGNHRMSEFSFAGTFVRAFGEGVLDGAQSFQVCTAATGCRAGLSSERAGAVPRPYGAAADCRGGIFAATVPEVSSAATVKRFGEPDLALPPCPPPPADPQAAAPELPSSAGAGTLTPARRKSAKPILEVELNAGSGTATLVAIVSDPGAMTMKGKGIRRVQKKAPRAGLYELSVVAKGAASRRLLSTGKAKVKLLFTFKPRGEEPSTQSKAVKLKRLVRF